MGVEAPETCWATHKRQVKNLWNCRIWLVNLFELKVLKLAKNFTPFKNRVTHFHLMPRLRMSRAGRPRPYTPAMCVTELSTRTVLSKLQEVHSKWQHSAIQCYPSSERALLFERFAGFVLLPLGWDQHVDDDDDECGALVEWCWEGKQEYWERNVLHIYCVRNKCTEMYIYCTYSTYILYWSTSGIVIHYVGGGCQSPNPQEIHCFIWEFWVWFGWPFSRT